VARIKDSSVEAVKTAADLVDVVSTRTQLRKSGARFTGRCPFHEERTPSFSVSPEKGLYYCFGCGAAGDVVTFVRETENLDFAGAVEWLADRYRITLEYEAASPEADARRRRTERLYALLEQATAFYERYLWDSEAGKPVREYLAGRALGADVCREFRLGLSPGGSTLSAKARERFTDAELAAAGLANRRGNDYFQHRLMFPLMDARGRVVGFSARKLREDDPQRGKYVNSPEGELFHKSAILYGLQLARGAIAKEERAIVVEGNTDAIALRQAGLEPAVASMGTALTDRQLRELARLTRKLFLCFDADAAGEAATLRGMELAAGQGFDVQVVPLPRGQDPADAAEELESLLARSEPYLVYRVRLEIERLLPDKQAGFTRVREILRSFEDSPQRQEALRVATDLLDLPRETQAGLAPSRRSAAGAVSPKLLEAGDRLELEALAGCVAHPELIALLGELGPEHFDGEPARRVRAHLVDRTPADEEIVRLLAELDARADQEGITEVTGKELLLRLRERALERELAEHPERQDLQEALARIREAAGALA
jgi:DNA primase